MTTSNKVELHPADPAVIQGVDGVEIKVTVRADQELQGLRSLKLDEDSAEVRVIYFFDTAKLELFNSGVVLRARLVKGDADDSTIKIRPIDPSKVTDSWRLKQGFKVEADRTGDQVVCSASLTAIQTHDDINAVADGKASVDSIFNKQQILFLSEFAPNPVKINDLQPLGPIRVLRWKTKHKNYAPTLTTEEWRLPDGEDLLEVSIKVAPEEAAEAQATFYEHLRSLGLDPAGAQATKTRTALEYFSHSLQTSG